MIKCELYLQEKTPSKPKQYKESSVVTKAVDAETETKTEAAGFETEAKTEAVYLKTEAKAQGSWPILLTVLSFPNC